MFIKYDTGEIMLVNLIGIAENINVRLEKTQLRMENTSISLHNTKTFKIVNKSELMVKFNWKLYPNEAEEEHNRSRKLIEVAALESQAVQPSPQKSKKLETFDRSIAKRIYKNKTREIKDFTFGFESKEFKIHPLEGTIWPGSSVDISVTFEPSFAGDYAALPYCEVEGRESRIPLQLKVYTSNLRALH
jgi:hydrocephalus-inducing protein